MRTLPLALLSIGTCTLLVFCGKSQPSEGTTEMRGSGDHGIINSCSFAELNNLSLTAIYDRNGNKIPDSSVNSDQVAWTILTPNEYPSFNGLGCYANKCSGTLLETNSSDPNAPAYVITNGHCIGTSLMNATDRIFNRPEASGNKLYLNFYVDTVAQNQQTSVAAKTIAFASMNNTDVGLVELDTTLASLKSQGFCAYSLATSRPQAGQKVFMAGVPMTGVDRDKFGIHYAHCQIGETVAVWEGNYRFLDSFRHRCSIVGGNSGSALLDWNTKKIVGLVNTAVNDSAASQEDCTLDKPCEKDSLGATSTHPQENYGQYVNYLAGCFNQAGVFDATLTSCGIKSKWATP